jgi:SAM-dependent methyltransferase
MTPELYQAHDRLEAQHWWFEGRRRIIGDVLKRHLVPRTHRTLLDVGCGTGGMFPLLATFGVVEGAESSDDARERALRKFPNHRVSPCWLPDTLPDGAWDVVTAFDVIEHVDQPVQSLETMRDRLKTDGQLVVTVPAFEFLWSRHDEQNHHVRRYSRLELMSQLACAGFRVTWVNYFNSLLFPAVAAVRALEKRMPTRFRHEQADLQETAGVANGFLTALFGAERFAVSRRSLPFGVSLIAVASKT